MTAEVEEEFYHATELLGRRDGMEDSHAIHCGNNNRGSTEPCLFAVFDGHGGDECPRFCAANFCGELSCNVNFYEKPPLALKETFERIDLQYFKVAQELALEDGSTGTIVLLHMIDGKLHYYVAQVGDSRAILIKENGTGREFMEDHTPMREDERNRITEFGGGVSYDEDNNIYRVTSLLGGGLAVTRAFGDYNFKPFVTSEPEIITGVVEDDDEFLCVASDGLWGDLSNDEVAETYVAKGCKKATEFVAYEAFSRGSDDNITVIGIDLKLAKKKLAPYDIVRNPPPVISPEESLSLPHRASENEPLTASLLRKISRASSQHGKLKDDEQQQQQQAQTENELVPNGGSILDNQLILWQNPLVSLLWFLSLQTLCILTIVYGYSLIILLSIGISIRLIGAFISYRFGEVLNHFGFPKAKHKMMQFLRKNQNYNKDAVAQFSNALVTSFNWYVEQWRELVFDGSLTRVLIILRTLTYLYIPMPISIVGWFIVSYLFTVPYVYLKNKKRIDVILKAVKEFLTLRLEVFKVDMKKKIDGISNTNRATVVATNGSVKGKKAIKQYSTLAPQGIAIKVNDSSLSDAL